MRKFLVLLAMAIAVVFSSNAADTDLNIVKAEYSRPGVAESFLIGSDLLKLPDYKDRAGWAKYFGPQAAAVIARGESYLNYEWKVIPATAYLEYERTGNRVVMENLYFANNKAIMSLFLAELAEGKGRFLDQLVNGVWQATQINSWLLSAHQPGQHSKRALPDEREHLVDIFSARFGAMMSLIHYYFHTEFDQIDPSISLAMESAVKRNILDPYLDPNQHQIHFWMGYKQNKTYGNWTPWCTSDAMTCFFLMEKDPSRLKAAIDQSVMSMDAFLNYIPKDGACEEGPGYWAAAAGKMYDYFQMMYDASDGKFNMFSNSRIRKISEFTSRAYIGDGWLVNFADATAKRIAVPEIMWSFGNATGSNEAKDYALCCLEDEKSGKFNYPEVNSEDAFMALSYLRNYPQIYSQVDSLNSLLKGSSIDAVMAGLRKEVPEATWYPLTQFCYFRNKSQWFFGAKGGDNKEKGHNHNDIGTFVLFIKDIPVFVDAGTQTYTKQSFQPGERYKIWLTQGQWHNIPIINGVAQCSGAQYMATGLKCDQSKGVFSLELQQAYPDSTQCQYFKRTYKMALSGKPSFTVIDQFKLASRKGPDIEHFLVDGEVEIHEGYLIIHCDKGLNVRLEYPKCLTATYDTKTFTDPVLTNVWGPNLKRINLTSTPNAPSQGSYILRIML